MFTAETQRRRVKRGQNGAPFSPAADASHSGPGAEEAESAEGYPAPAFATVAEFLLSLLSFSAPLRLSGDPEPRTPQPQCSPLPLRANSGRDAVSPKHASAPFCFCFTPRRGTPVRGPLSGASSLIFSPGTKAPRLGPLGFSVLCFLCAPRQRTFQSQQSTLTLFAFVLLCASASPR